VLRALKPLCVAAGVPLFANDRPDLAKMASCDGVHVGQDDLDIADVRRFAPDLKVGVSTHDEMQLRIAVAAAPDYVAFGPVFATASKERPDPVVGVEGLARAASIVAKRVPLVAIGGIDLERASLIAPIADAGAVIAALLPPDQTTDVEARARALHRALGGL
jgi:thiamine-phosphate pyrophosphorylase